MLLVTIETLRYERDCLRKAREAPLIHKAKTIGPLGIKKRNELYSLCNVPCTSVTSVYYFTVVYTRYILHVFPK